jgi:hypothetical protein
VSVSLVPDSYVLQGLAPITLHVVVTANGGEMDDTVFGAIVYDTARVTPATLTQNGLPPGDWTQGVLGCNTSRRFAFNQVHSSGPTAINVTSFVIATLTFDVISTDDGGIWFAWQTACRRSSSTSSASPARPACAST